MLKDCIALRGVTLLVDPQETTDQQPPGGPVQDTQCTQPVVVALSNPSGGVAARGSALATSPVDSCTISWGGPRGVCC